MAKNRKAAEQVIITYIEKMLPGGGNKEIYEKLFAGMSDDQFDLFMTRLEEGSIHLAIVAPNLRKPMLDTKRNYDIARELGHNFFPRIWMDPKNGAPAFLTPVRYLVVDLPLRRQAQLQIKKISIPEHNRSVDNLTGQPTGASKGSKISFPELNILASLKLDASIVELIKFRGGDTQGFNAMNDFIYRTGGVSQQAISALGTEVKATRALSTFLLGMHLSNTLLS